MALIAGGADIGIVCSDFETSLTFYRDAVGMEVIADIPEVPSYIAVGAGLAPTTFRQVRLRSGSTLFKLMDIKSPPGPRSAEFAAGIRWLTLFTDDIHALHKRLVARNVAFVSPPIEAPDAVGVCCALAPDGLLLELVQMKPAPGTMASGVIGSKVALAAAVGLLAAAGAAIAIRRR